MSSQEKKELAKGEKSAFSRLVANLTHELKTPLHSILAVSSILASEADGKLSAEQKKQVAMIARNGEQLLELINDLLEFSSLDPSARKVQHQSFDIVQLIEDVLAGVTPVAEQSRVALAVEMNKLAEKFSSDRTLVRQIVHNLLTNAVKFSPDGGKVSIFAETLKDGSFSCQVSDSGIGMPSDVVNSIFTEFYQAEAGDSRRFGGIGLGLSLVKRSLDLLDGSIEVQSEPDRGTIFVVRIPDSKDKVAKSTILIADEDQGVQLSLSECFRREGYTSIISAGSSELAREIVEERPDLVMLALKPPVSESFVLLEGLRSAAWGKEIPIILMSTLDGVDERSRGFELGANDFIVKPFDVTELLARVRAQLGRKW